MLRFATDPERGARIAAALLWLAAGCSGVRDAADTAAHRLNPFASTDLFVRSVSVHGPYLLAEVSGRQEDLRFLAPASEICARVLRPEAQLRYRKFGNFGRLVAGDESCDPVGVASLEQWRNRRPRPRTRSVVPRSNARFALVHEDDQYLFVRGRFALASRIGIPAGFDLIAMLPSDEACRAVAARGVASLEFRVAGRDPFRLLDGARTCVVAGFAMPVNPQP